jgi:DNA-binding NarL/FixJ family response regulator
MIRLGANGFVNKDIQREDLIDAIYNANFRGMHAQSDEMRLLFDRPSDVNTYETEIESSASMRLKDRDVLILRDICDGYTSEEIADRVNLSKQSIDLHRMKLITHFNARNMAHLVTEAIRHGYYIP